MYLICRRNDNKGEKKDETNILRNRYKNPQKIRWKCVLCVVFLVVIVNLFVYGAINISGCLSSELSVIILSSDPVGKSSHLS